MQGLDAWTHKQTLSIAIKIAIHSCGVHAEAELIVGPHAPAAPVPS